MINPDATSTPSNEAKIISARWVVPVEPRGEVLPHHSLLIEDGEIRELLPTEIAIKKYSALPKTDLSTHVLIPGLINAHTHAAMNLLRGFADDVSLHAWLHNHIWPVESKWVDASFVRDGTELAIGEMLRGGTTMFADMYFYPEDAARVAQQCGIRSVIGLMVMDFPTAWGEGPDDYFEKGLQVHDGVRSLSLVSTMLTPHAPYTVSDAPLSQAMTYADELQIPLQMHVHETETEIQEALAEHGERPIQRLANLGLLNPRMIAVHMTQLTDDEIQLVSQQGVHTVHCPNSNAKLASGTCRVNDLLTAGANVALGTDGAASNNNLDMFGEMRAAALTAKQVSQSASSVPAWQALEMATLNGAKAFNLQDQLGSIAPGKRADLTAVDLNHLATQPVYDPVAQLVYAASRDQVSDVWVDGKRVLRDRQLQTVDAEKITQRAHQWSQKISSGEQ